MVLSMTALSLSSKNFGCSARQEGGECPPRAVNAGRKDLHLLRTPETFSKGGRVKPT